VRRYGVARRLYLRVRNWRIVMDASPLGGEIRLDRSEAAIKNHETWSTAVAIMEDGADLNQTVTDLNDAGISRENLTVVLKRPDPEEPEPFPDGTRYIVVPDDSRGLELAIGFAAVFAVSALLFAFTTPSIGLVLFLFFIVLAALLAVSSFVRVGVVPILIDMEAPAEESGLWNDEFERGKVLLFASAQSWRYLKPVWEMFQDQGIYFDVIGRRLEPRPVSGAVLHYVALDGSQRDVVKESGEA
jgi:hypothetical protein